MDAEPINELDAAAREHDIAYGRYGRPGYTWWNPADQAMYQRIEKIPGPTASMTRMILRSKRNIQAPGASLYPMELSQIHGVPDLEPNQPAKKSRLATEQNASPVMMYSKLLVTKNHFENLRRQSMVRKGKSSSKATRRMLKRVRKRNARKRRAWKRKRKSAGLSRLAKKYIRNYIARRPKSVGRWKRYVKQTGTYQQSSSNQVSYGSVTILSSTLCKTLINSYKQLGMTDALAERIESYDNNTDYELMGRIHGTWTSRVTYKNNSNFSVYIDIYYVVPKCHTDNTPDTEIAAGLDDLYGVAASAEQSLNLFPTNSKAFRQRYQIIKHAKGLYIQPGESVVVMCKRKFRYDDDIHDQEPFTYMKGASGLVLSRLHGDLSHDSVTRSQVGITNASIDILSQVWISYQHEQPGNEVREDTYVDGLDTMTVGPALFNYSNVQKDTYEE